MNGNAGRTAAKYTIPEQMFSFLHLETGEEEPPPPEDFFASISLPNSDLDADATEDALRQRIRELNCLYGIGEIIKNNSNSIHKILQEIAGFLPLGWQYPEITCARIVFYGNVFSSKGFIPTRWRLNHPISIYDRHVGDVTVCYLEERPPADEGPFLFEQRVLLAAVAEQVSCTVRRISANIELKEMGWRLTVQQQALQEANAALRALTLQVEEERQEIHRNTQENLERVLTPLLDALTTQSSSPKRKELAFLRQQVKEATSPFTRRLTQQCYSLTPSEIAICNFIRTGLKTKDIAEMRGVSVATINRHREHIRKKLGIANSDVNLTTFLQSAMWDQN